MKLSVIISLLLTFVMTDVVFDLIHTQDDVNTRIESQTVDSSESEPKEPRESCEDKSSTDFCHVLLYDGQAILIADQLTSKKQRKCLIGLFKETHSPPPEQYDI